MDALQPGDTAPDFSLTVLQDGVRRLFRLADHRGSNLVVLFHALNWTPESERLIHTWNGHNEAIHAQGAEIIAVSVDSVFNTMAWEKAIGPVRVWLGSDYWPHGDAAAKFGVLQTTGPEAGVARHAVFLVDKAGRIAFARVSPPGEAPDPVEMLAELSKLNSAVA